MTERENLIALLRREKFKWIPVEFFLCPELVKLYQQETKSSQSYQDYFHMPWRDVEDIYMEERKEQYRPYHPTQKEGTIIDIWGVGHEPGSAAAKHMTYMRCPLRGIETLEEIRSYPFPDFTKGDQTHQKKQVQEIQGRGLAAVGNMQMTIWETAWYLRSMEDLMVDMMTDDPIADYIFAQVTKQAIVRALSYVNAGVDILFFGDDIGTQRGNMMSKELYRQWIWPRLKQLIDTVRRVNPNILIFYHSCGNVTNFIPDLIEAGVDVLNPIQSECMDFEEIYKEYGGKISFHGTIGTQTTMPHGSEREIREEVHKNLDIAKKYGGLFVAPTHMLEPEVPWENILAYVEACRTYTL